MQLKAAARAKAAAAVTPNSNLAPHSKSLVPEGQSPAVAKPPLPGPKMSFLEEMAARKPLKKAPAAPISSTVEAEAMKPVTQKNSLQAPATNPEPVQKTKRVVSFAAAPSEARLS